MKGFFNLFVRSAKELKSIRCLAVTSMLIALDLVLKFTITIPITDSLKISFAFIALSAIGMLYGPTVGALAGFITDILGFIIKPSGAFDIRYTLIEVLGAVIYGLFLYNAMRDKWMLPRIVVAKTLVVIVCNLFLTTLVSASYYGKGFFALFPTRAIKNLAQLPVDIFLLALFLPFILKAFEVVFKGVRKCDENLVFSDANVTKAFMIIISLMLIIVCSLGLAGQYLKDRADALEDTIESQQEEIDHLYSQLGIAKPIEEPAE
ncbi:MAG: folate family ECF transporter S component [Oscillospiraceae bacterium]|nr:folate family ECF transporter S component [Oscillospiraceae bacterium]